MKLIFSNGKGVVATGARSFDIDALPAFSFACDGLFYDEFGGYFILFSGGGQLDMTAAQRDEVAAWIRAQ